MSSAERNGSSMHRRGTFLPSFGRPIYHNNLMFVVVHSESKTRTSSKASLRYGS
jgi:hypothetical protein